MTNKTKIIFILIAVITVFAIDALSVSATDPVNLTDKLGTVGLAAGFGNTQPSLATTVGQIIRGFLSLLGIIFMAYLIYGGYLWMTARGNEETLEKAKKIIRGSIIGIIIVFSAYAITYFVISRLEQATGYNETQYPPLPGGDQPD